MQVVRVGLLADDPLDAAAAFHADIVPQVRAVLKDGQGALALVFAPADHTHCGWRLAAVQALARAAAPGRVNGVAGGDEAAIAAALAYLAAAPGLTGQYLPLDGAGAGTVV